MMKNELEPFAKLSIRQEQILDCVALGYSVKEIADILFICEATVASHIRMIKEITKAQKATELSMIWFCRKYDVSIKDLIGKRLIPLMIFLALSVFQIVDQNGDIMRPARRGRRKHETELII